jgi:hypothetical protein
MGSIVVPTPGRPVGGGHYGICVNTGLLAAALTAGVPVFAFRFAPSVTGRYRAVLKRLYMQGMTRTAYTTAQAIGFRAFKARSYTASDSGGTDVKPATGDGKRQNGYPDTKAADIRVATTAKITAGTRTVEATPFAAMEYWAGAIGAGPIVPHEYIMGPQSVPQVFYDNEGFVIHNEILMGAVGVTQLWLELDWTEEEIGDWTW